MNTRQEHVPVRTIMTWPVTTIDHNATLRSAVDALAADHVGALLVLGNGGHLAGLLSERDVVAHVAAGADLALMTVGEAMSCELVTVSPEDHVVSAAGAMVEADVRHLPVLDGDLVAGMLSIRDVTSVLARLAFAMS